ncbi:MAG TPA: AAA family ATPase [Planctomycetota bacterium]|nr:AAA family ATPase [Planctomycetota bacterium]
MKVLAIRGRNLASLAGDFSVDLADGPLGAAGLFAITGPTGAGKSTLLDTLCLPLYNRTPRLGGRGGKSSDTVESEVSSGDARNLLRRGAGEGFAEVDFTASDGRTYRATWRARRSRNQAAGKLQEVSLELLELPMQRPKHLSRTTDTLKLIESLVGLTYDQFCRSVLLAQGDFAAFLKASQHERSELLEAMTGTEIYSEISRQAFETAKEQRLRLEALQKSLPALMLSDAELEGLETSITAQQEQEARLNTEMQRCERELGWHTELDRLRSDERRAQDDLRKFETALAAMTTALPERAEFVTQLARARELDLQIGSARKLLGESRVAYEAAQTAMKSAAAEADAARKDLTSIETHAHALERWLKDNCAWSRAAAEWPLVQQLLKQALTARTKAHGIATELNALRKDLELARKSAAEAQKNSKAFQKNCADAQEALAAAEAEKKRAEKDANPSELDKARKQATALEELCRLLQDFIRSRDRAQQEQGAATAHRAAAEKSLVAADAARSEAVPLEEKLQEVQRELDWITAALSLEEHRERLKPGERCPLCGSTEHPLAKHNDAGVKLEKTHRRKADDLQKKLKALNADEACARARGSEEQRQAERAAERAAEHEKEATVATEAWRKRCERLKGMRVPDAPGDANGDDLQRKRDAAAETVQALEAIEKNARSAAERYSAAVADWTDAQKKNAEAVEQATLALQRAERLGSEVRHGEEQAAAASKTEREAVEQLEPTFEGLRDWQREFSADGQKFHTRCEHETARFLEQQRELQKCESKLNAVRPEVFAREGSLREKQALEAEAMAAAKRRVDEVGALEMERRALLNGKSVDEGERVLRECSAAKIRLEERIRAREAHEGTKPPEYSPDEIKERREALKADLQSIRQNLEKKVGMRALERDRRQQFQTASSQIATQQKKLELWEGISGLIGSKDGQKFRTFAQSLTLNLLLAHANRNLKELAPRYSLERTPGTDMDLQIVDLDMGQERRAINTLSGGESFLVSLGLALGLSSMAARRTRIESLFIDEGFGSLDVDTLEAALSVLDALQAGGRQVGIISHVPGLAERIGAQVRVIPRGGGRSEVKVV